jgi:hypothetical protein
MAAMSDPFEDEPTRRPTWVRVVAAIALLSMLIFVIAQVL